MKASIGDIVLYHHPGSLDGHFPPSVSPGIVRDIDLENPSRVQIYVIGPLGQHTDWCDYGTGSRQWSERV